MEVNPNFLVWFFLSFFNILLIIWKAACWSEEIHSFYFDITMKSILLLKLVSLIQIGCSFSWCFVIRFLNNQTDCFKKSLFSCTSKIVFKEECNSMGDTCMRRDRLMYIMQIKYIYFDSYLLNIGSSYYLEDWHQRLVVRLIRSTF